MAWTKVESVVDRFSGIHLYSLQTTEMPMIVTLALVQVKPEFSLTTCIEASRHNHENSVKESGNLRFDIIQDAQDKSNRFV